MTRDLAGRAAFVTGASRTAGIGAAICRALADRGADVFFTHWSAYDERHAWGSTRNDVADLTRHLQQRRVCSGERALDLSDPTAIPDALAAAESAVGPLSILVNNAAHFAQDGYERLDADGLDAHYAVNVRGTFLLSVEFARRFRRGIGGRIINLTTNISRGPMPGELAYSSTKAAVDAFTRTLAQEVAGCGITVNAVNPGVTDTGWATEAEKPQWEQRIARGRLGQPDDAARLVGFLASPDAEWITGQIISSDGGLVYQ